MCFRLQTVVWKFLWQDWTFHWRVAEPQCRVLLKQPSVRPTPPAHLLIRWKPWRGKRWYDATPATLEWGILWSFSHTDFGWLHKCHWPPSSRKSLRPVIEIDTSVPRCWLTRATRQMSRKPTGGDYLTLHLQIFLLWLLTTVQEGGNPFNKQVKIKYSNREYIKQCNLYASLY